AGDAALRPCGRRARSAWHRPCFWPGPADKIAAADPLAGECAMPRLLLLLTLLVAVPTFARASTSADEVRFGIDVARRGLWRAARFRFEKAVQQDPDNAAALNDLAIALEQEGEF